MDTFISHEANCDNDEDCNGRNHNLVPENKLIKLKFQTLKRETMHHIGYPLAL